MFYLFLFFLGWTFFIIGFVRKYVNKPCKTEYRYIPRKIIDEQLSFGNNNASQMMKKLVNQRNVMI